MSEHTIDPGLPSSIFMAGFELVPMFAESETASNAKVHRTLYGVPGLSAGVYALYGRRISDGEVQWDVNLELLGMKCFYQGPDVYELVKQVEEHALAALTILRQSQAWAASKLI